MIFGIRELCFILLGNNYNNLELGNYHVSLFYEERNSILELANNNIYYGEGNYALESGIHALFYGEVIALYN